MTRINLEVALLGEKPPLRALYIPDIKMVDIFVKDEIIDFSILLTLPQWRSFMNEFVKVGIAIEEQTIKKIEGEK